MFGDFELNGSLGLALDDRDALAHPVGYSEIGDLQTDQIAPTQLTVDRQIEEG